MKTTILTKVAAAAAAATAILSLTAPANAGTLKFGTDGILFDTDTEITFNFISSKGAAKSSLGIYNNSKQLLTTLFTESRMADVGNESDKKQWLGTASNLVEAATVKFRFFANQIYTLGLSGVLPHGANMGNVYSTSGLNSGGLQKTVFGSAGGTEKVNYTATAATQTNASLALNPLNGPVLISFEDKTWQPDNDFNDFTVEAVPEPITMAGMALGAGGMAIARRRRNRKTA
jgi:hypothetical protein